MTAREPNASQLQMLLDRIEACLPPPSRWSTPSGYRQSLALCVVDSIQSIGVRYRSVEKVVSRYRSLRADAGGSADTDDLAALAKTFVDLGGAVGWAAQLGTRHRTSTSPGAPLKAEVIWRAAEDLPGKAGVSTAADLRGLVDDPARWNTVRLLWTSLPGQRSGISWHYVNMLAGVPGVKPDRMIRRFVTRALGDSFSLTDDDLVRLVRLAARRLEVVDDLLDHAIWRFESGRQRADASDLSIQATER